MARMPDQLPSVRSPRGPGLARMPQADTSSGFRAIADSLNGIAEFEAEKRARARAEDDALALATSVTRFRAEQTERLIKEGDELADDGIEGFSDRYAGVIDDTVETEIALLPERVRDRARAELTGVREDLRLRALEVEHGRRQARQGRLLDEQVQAAGATVYHDPTQYADVLSRGEEAINQSGLTEAAKAEALDRLPGIIAAQRMIGLVNSNPGLAVRELDGGEWDEELEVTQIAQFRDQAQRELDRRAAEAERRRLLALQRLQASLRIRMEDDLASIASTGQGVGVQLHDIERAFGGEAADAYMRQRRQAEDTHGLVSRWRFMSPSEIAQSVQREAPRPGQDGFVEQSERYERLSRAASSLIEQRGVDPAGAALAADPVLNQTFENMGAASPALRRQAVAELRERQTRLGIPAGAQRLTTNAQAQAYAARIRGADDAERTRALEEVSEEIAGIYGNQAPRALAEIARVAEMPELGAIAAAPDATSRRRLARALASPEPTLTDGQTRSINRHLASEFTDLRQSLVNTPGGLQRFEQAQEAARRAAALAVASGQNPDAAAREAARMYAGQYQFRAGLRIPRTWRGQPLNSRHMVEGAERLIEERAEAGAFVLPAGRGDVAAADQASAARDSFRLTARWVTSPNDEGLVLVDEFGDAIESADGAPITASWDELEQARARAEQRLRERQIDRLNQR